MKNTKLILVGLLSLTAVGLASSLFIRQSYQEAYAAIEHVGELNGGAKVTYAANTTNTVEQYVTATLVDNSNSSNNFYVRIKNKNNFAVDVHVIMESVNGHGSQIKANGSYVTYDPDGTQLETLRSVDGRFVTLPAKFDGCFSITSLNLADVPEWEQGDSTKDVKNIKAIHFGVIATTQDVSLDIGDVFTASVINLDASTLNDTEFAAKYAIKSGSAGISIARLPVDDFIPNHDLNGAALTMVQQKDDDIPAYFMFLPEEADLSNDNCIFIRMKNGWLYQFYIQFYVLSTNSHRMSLGLNKTIYYYDNQGQNKTTHPSRDFGSYLYVPGSFDGYIGIPYTSLIDESTQTWPDNQAHPTMDYSSVYALIFGLSTKHDYAAQPIFGDIFTNSATIFDGSEYTPTQFKQRVVPDEHGNGEYINLSQLAGYKDQQIVDYSQVTNYMTTEVDGGVEVSASLSELDTRSSFKINFNTSIPSTAPAVAIRVKNYTYDYPYLLYVTDGNGRTCSTQGQLLGNVYFLDNKGELIVNDWGGNVVFVKIPTGFDGLMIIPFASLDGGNDLDKSQLRSYEFQIATMYDYNFHSSFGDFGYIDENLAYQPLVDASTLNDADWASTYVVGANPDYISLSRTKSVPKCSWIGDTKILNSMIYEDDATMATELLTDDNDNPLTYTRTENGVVITPSEYEIGHVNGPYSALVLLNNPNYRDRVDMYRPSDLAPAKGLTLYVKNMSSREIGISLQFDQVTASGALQRWALIGYPSMYYAYDVVKDADYTFYFKRDQFQIPVGFEGYVRLPFSSYGIPDWCKSNEDLNIDKFSGIMYITQDNRTYGGLTYLVKNVGVYFNDTSAGSLFSSGNTIKTNMGL